MQKFQHGIEGLQKDYDLLMQKANDIIAEASEVKEMIDRLRSLDSPGGPPNPHGVTNNNEKVPVDETLEDWTPLIRDILHAAGHRLSSGEIYTELIKRGRKVYPNAKQPSSLFGMNLTRSTAFERENGGYWPK